MNSVFSIATSGLQAATARLDQAAAATAAMSVGSNGRMDFARQASATDRAAAAWQASPALGDMSSNLVEQMSALYDFKANIRVVQAQDEMLGTLLDARA